MEMMLRHYPNVMQCRVRMPIDVDLHNPRNFITKIANYAKVVNMPNSMTVLEEFVPMAVEGALRRLTGAYNWTNSGAISHNEVLELYRDYLHPEFTWENFTEVEQAEVIKGELHGSGAGGGHQDSEVQQHHVRQEDPRRLPQGARHQGIHYQVRDGAQQKCGA